MSISKQDIDRAVLAFNKYPPLAKGRMPEVLDRVFHSVVGLREGQRAGWTREMLEYWHRDLGRALEMWRIAREEVEEEEERERPIPCDDAQPVDRTAGS